MNYSPDSRQQARDIFFNRSKDKSSLHIKTMMRFLIPHLHNSPSNKFQDNEAEVEEPSALLVFRLFNNSGTIRVAFSWKQPIQAITAIATGRSQTSCISLINLNLHNYIGTYIHYIKIGDSHLVSDCFYIYKWLGIKKIGVIFKMTNENVRFNSSQKYAYFLNLQFFS